MIYCIEKMTGFVKFNRHTKFLEDTTNMEEIEYWEDNLDKLKEQYIIAYKIINKKVFYTIFCNTKKKGSKFK